MKVLLKKVGEAPKEVECENALSAFQKLVGGFIEHLKINETLGVLVNEEGKLAGLPYNCTIFGERLMGDIVFIGYNGEENFGDVQPGSEWVIKYITRDDWRAGE